jgi:hypothetical protein
MGMIDLDRLIQWALVGFCAGTLVLITHILTVEIMFQRFQELSADIHEQRIEIPVASDFPLPRLNSLDSLAYCISMVNQMEKDNQ